MEKHFVTFYSPGTFVDEESTYPIKSWDVEEAKKKAKSITERHNATPYGFQFTTRARKDDELDSREVAQSPLYYLGGLIETLAEVKARATDKDSILISNMECNNWHRIITNTNSWKITKPLNKTDIVLPWPE